MIIEPLPPAVNTGHAKLLKEMRECIDHYAGNLAEHLLPKMTGSIAPTPAAYIEARQKFLGDMHLKLLLRELAQMKLLFERPRFLIRNVEEPGCKK